MASYGLRSTPTWNRTPEVNKTDSLSQGLGIAQQGMGLIGNLILHSKAKQEEKVGTALKLAGSYVEDRKTRLATLAKDDPEAAALIKPYYDKVESDYNNLVLNKDKIKSLNDISLALSQSTNQFEHAIASPLDQLAQKQAETNKMNEQQKLFSKITSRTGKPDPRQQEENRRILSGGAGVSEMAPMVAAGAVNPMMPVDQSPNVVNQVLGPQTANTMLQRSNNVQLGVPSVPNVTNARTKPVLPSAKDVAPLLAGNQVAPNTLGAPSGQTAVTPDNTAPVVDPNSVYGNEKGAVVPKNTKEAVKNIFNTISNKVDLALTGKDANDFMQLSAKEQNKQIDQVIRDHDMNPDTMTPAERGKLRLKIKAQIIKLRSKKKPAEEELVK